MKSKSLTFSKIIQLAITVGIYNIINNLVLLNITSTCSPAIFIATNDCCKLSARSNLSEEKRCDFVPCVGERLGLGPGGAACSGDHLSAGEPIFAATRRYGCQLISRA